MPAWTLPVIGAASVLILIPLLYRDHRLGMRTAPAFVYPSPPATSAPRATSVAYEAAFRQLQDQLKSLTDVDTKLGVAIGALGVLMAAFVAANPPLGEKGMIGALLIVALRDAYRGFRFDHYRYAPGYKGLLAEAHSPPSLVKWYGFLAMAEAIETNRVRLTLKGLFLNRTVTAIALIVVVAIAGRVFSIG